MTDGRKSRPRITPSAGTIRCTTVKAYTQMVDMYKRIAITKIIITKNMKKILSQVQVISQIFLNWKFFVDEISDTKTPSVTDSTNIKAKWSTTSVVTCNG